MKRYLDINWRYMRTQRRMRGLTILGIILATILMVSIGDYAYSSFEDDIIRSKEEYGNYIYRFERVTKEVAKKIEEDKEVKNSALARDEGYSCLKINSKNKKELIIGMDALDERALKNIFTVQIDKGTYPKDHNEILISRELINLIAQNKTVGDIIEIPIGKYPFEVDNRFVADPSKFIWKPEKIRSFKIAGITKNEVYKDRQREFIDYTIIGFLNGNEESVVGEDSYKLYTTVGSRSYVEKLTKRLGLAYMGVPVDGTIYFQGLPKSNVKFQMQTEIVSDQRNLLNNKNLFIPTLFIVLYVIAMIYTSFNISLLERIKQFGILRCIGATKNQIKRIVLLECLTMLAIAMPIGLLLGTFGVKAILDGINKVVGNELFHMNFYGEVIIISIIVLFIAVLYAAFKAILAEAHLSPIEAMNNFAVMNKVGQEFKIFEMKKMPGVSKTEKLLTKLFKIEGLMAYKNIDRNKKRNKVCSLSLASSIILFMILTSTFLVQKNATDNYIPSDKWNIEVSKSYDYLNDEDYETLKGINGVNDIYKNIFIKSYVSVNREKLNQGYIEAMENREKSTDGIKRIEKKGLNLVTRIMLATDDLSMYKEYIKYGDISKEKLDDDGVIIVNSGEKEFLRRAPEGSVKDIAKFSNITTCNIGDTIIVPLNDEGELYKFDNSKVKYGEGMKLKVVAIVNRVPFFNKQDFKEDLGIVVSEKTYKKLVGDTRFSSIYINGNLDESKRVDLMKNINSYSNKGSDNVTDYIETMKEQKIKAEKELKSGAIFGVMILIIGMLNITNTLGANILVRRKELASLRSMGMEEEQMIKMVLLEGGITGYKASLPGVIFGGILTFGGQMYLMSNNSQNAIFILIMATLIAIAFIIMIALMATIPPAKNLGKMSIVDNIKSGDI